MTNVPVDSNMTAPSVAKQDKKNWLWTTVIVAVWLLALVVRLYYVTHTVVIQQVNIPGAHGDAAQYYRYAYNLVNHMTFSSADPRATRQTADSFRDPVYPAFLALWMKIFPDWDHWYAAVLLSQAIMGSFTAIFWLCLARRWMTLPWLASAGVFLALWPHCVTSNSDLLTETVYGFFVALALLLLNITRVTKPVFMIGTGMAFAMAALTNAVSLPLSLLLAVFARIRRRVSTKQASVLLATVLCVVTPWLVRNATLPPTDMSSSNRAVMNFVEGSWPIYHSADMAMSAANDPAATKAMDRINFEILAFEASKRLGAQLMLERMESSPWQYIIWYLQKPALMWGWDIGIGAGDIYFHATYHSPFRTSAAGRAIAAVCEALNPILMLLGAVGCLIGLVDKRTPAGWAELSLLLVTVTVIHSVLQADARYSTPYRGGEIVLALATTRWLASHVRRLRKRRYGANV